MSAKCHCGVQALSDLPAERGLIARLLEGDASALKIVGADDFFSGGHGMIFKAIAEAHARDGRIDVVRVVEVLRERGVHYVMLGVDISEYLDEILREYEWGSTTSRYAQRVLKAHRAREISTLLVRADACIRAGFDADRVIAALTAKIQADRRAGGGAKEGSMKRPASRTAAAMARTRASAMAVEWKPGTFGIDVDTREQTPWAIVPSIPVTVRKLDIGDYAPSGFAQRCAIERKSLGDFIGSVTWEHERFRAELEKLRGLDFAAVIVEATVEDVRERRFRARVSGDFVLSTAATIAIKYRTPVLFCGPPACAGEYAVRLLRSFFQNASKAVAA